MPYATCLYTRYSYRVQTNILVCTIDMHCECCLKIAHLATEVIPRTREYSCIEFIRIHLKFKGYTACKTALSKHKSSVDIHEAKTDI